MKRTSLIVTIFVLMSLLFLGLSFVPEARATTLYVGGAGPGNYTTIQAAIDDAMPGDRIYVFSKWYYQDITVNKSLTLIGEDREATVIYGSGSGDAVYITSDWVNMTGFSVKHSGELSTDAGIELDTVRNCHIDDVNASEDGSGIRVVRSDNVTISGSIAARNNHTGIDVYSSSNTVVADNTVYWNGGYGIAIRLSRTATVSGNTMVGNSITMYGNLLEYWNTHAIDTLNTVNGKPVIYWKDAVGGTVPSGAGQVILANCSKVIVENQNMNNGSIGMILGFSSNNTMSNNTITSNTVHSIRIMYSDNNTLINNTATANEKYGIFITYSGGSTLVKNNAQNNSIGVYLAFTEGNSIVQNEAGGNRVGISLVSSSNSTVEGNDAYSSDQHGISLSGSNNTLVNNDAHSCNWSGFGIRGSDNIVVGNRAWYNSNGISFSNSYDNTIAENDVWENDNGISIHASANNTVANNTLSRNNNSGFSLWGANDNRIYHNRILNNTIQARDTTGLNMWDDGYPSGGNYWSDYSGTDWYRGPEQNIQGSDGIGDTPYLIDSDSLDRYPLLSPGTAYPLPPEDVSAILSGGNFENVTISWDASPDESTGLVDRYDILRGENLNTSANLYTNMGSVPNGTHQFVDAFAGEGNPNTYFYAICAINTTNDSTCADNQAGKFTRSLPTGLNLVSIPLIQSDESIETVLQTVTYDNAWLYDSSSEEWTWYMTSKTYRRGLWNMNHTDGMWVNITGDCNLTVAGIVPAQTTIHLYRGWNLVSFPSFNTSYSASNLKTEIGATRVEGYDPAPPNFLRVLGGPDVLQAGFGYWVKVEAATDWIVEVS